MGINILADLKRDNNFRYFFRISERTKSKGFFTVIKEMRLYYKKYSKFPLLIGAKKVDYKYKLFVIYNYFKIIAIHPGITLENILNYFPTRMQQFFIYKLDPKENRELTFDKILFYQKLRQFKLPFPITFFYTKNGHKYNLDEDLVNLQKSDISPKVFVKPIRDNGGVNAGVFLKDDLKTIDDGFVVQELVKNHPKIIELSGDFAFNTFRIITYLDNDNNVNILSAIYRLSKGKEVDNWGRGSINVPVDIDSGQLGRYGITKNFERYEQHPAGNTLFHGYQVPAWAEIIEIVSRGSILFNNLRFIAWDIGLSNQGPVIVEANAGCDFFHAQLFQPYGDSVLIRDLINQNKKDQ